MAVLNSEDGIEDDAIPPLAAGEAFSHVYVLSGDAMFRATADQVREGLAEGAGLPQPPPPMFRDFFDTPAGGSVVLVPAPGVPMAHYRYRVGERGEVKDAPVDGLIVAGNVTGRVYAFSVATAARRQSELGVSEDFTVPLIGVELPETKIYRPVAPEFKNHRDTQAGGSVQLLPALNVPMEDYRWKVGTDGTYAQVPGDGVITVGNVDGQVFAYSEPGLNRAKSPTGASPVFTAYVVGGTAPTAAPAPTFDNFNDTPTGGSVQLVPAAGIPITDYLYRFGLTGEYLPVPDDGIIVVGNFDGQVYAYSVAAGVRQQSPTGVSRAFTQYAAPVPGNTTPAPPNFADFNDTDAGGTVRLVIAAGLTLADYRVALPGAADFNPVSDATIAVGNAAGTVRAYVAAGPGRNQSPNGTSEAFTSYTAPPVPPPAATFTPTLTGPSATENSGVTLTTTEADQVEFAVIANPANTDPKRLDFTLGGVQVGLLDFPASYLGAAFRYRRAGATAINTFTFVDGAEYAI